MDYTVNCKVDWTVRKVGGGGGGGGGGGKEAFFGVFLFFWSLWVYVVMMVRGRMECL